MGQEPIFSFTYENFERVLQAIRSNFELGMLSQATPLPHKTAKPKLILRHDVDVSLRRAFRMARIESEFGVRATYMVFTNSKLYRARDIASRDILVQLIDMGHEVGLHFDVDDEPDSTCDLRPVQAQIDSACKELAAITGSPVLSVSLHRPITQFLRGPFKVAGRINAYSKELMAWYLSDSKGRWREGNPLPKLLQPEKPLLQLLIHPVWWGDEHMAPKDRLQEFVDSETRGQSLEHVKAFDAALAAAVPGVRRKGQVNHPQAAQQLTRTRDTGK